MSLRTGMLVTVPVPEAAALDEAVANEAIAAALAAAAEQNIRGKNLTPFLLSHIAESTGEASLRANLALLENNARVGAQIAVAL
jgi:pseudouridine-5'-phosphate glycosidase